MKNALIVFALITLCFPSIARASWWDPMGWFKSKPVPAVSTVSTSTSSTETPSSKIFEENILLKATIESLNMKLAQCQKSPVMPPTQSSAQSSLQAISDTSGMTPGQIKEKKIQELDDQVTVLMSQKQEYQDQLNSLIDQENSEMKKGIVTLPDAVNRSRELFTRKNQEAQQALQSQIDVLNAQIVSLETGKTK